MLPDINWEAAINARRSVRNYQPQPLTEADREKLVNFTAGLELPFAHAVHIRFFRSAPDRRLYSVYTAPPDGAAFIAPTDPVSISQAGFVGELLVLYATSLGLGTCWYGHYALAELERIMPHLGEPAQSPLPRYGYGTKAVPGVRAIAVTPLGYWQPEGLRLVDRMSAAIFSFKRKPLAELMEAGSQADDLPPALAFALDLARKAPSAANSQFWRFGLTADKRSVTISRPVGYKHPKWEHPDADIGICACHAWLGLRLRGAAGPVSVREEEGRAVWRIEVEGRGD